MNIVLLGYGKTGHDIETVAVERGHVIVDRFTDIHPFSESHCAQLRTQSVDCCIDFSIPDAVVHNIRLSVQCGMPIVVGTTGWHVHLAEITALVDHHDGSLVHSSNFSLGANVFLKIVEAAAQLFDAFPDYDAAVHEIHHRFKKDAPSGTARTIAGILLRQLKRKHVMSTSPGETGVAANELLVSSSRLGSVFGTHTVAFASSADEIELTHRANNRRGFALGAVMAAEWVQGKHGVFTADDVFFSTVPDIL
jgi:4-hydroxy-tetrahydrodipicolinate reductase